MSEPQTSTTDTRPSGKYGQQVPKIVTASTLLTATSAATAEKAGGRPKPRKVGNAAKANSDSGVTAAMDTAEPAESVSIENARSDEGTPVSKTSDSDATPAKSVSIENANSDEGTPVSKTSDSGAAPAKSVSTENGNSDNGTPASKTSDSGAAPAMDTAEPAKLVAAKHAKSADRATPALEKSEAKKKLTSSKGIADIDPVPSPVRSNSAEMANTEASTRMASEEPESGGTRRKALSPNEMQRIRDKIVRMEKNSKGMAKDNNRLTEGVSKAVKSKKAQVKKDRVDFTNVAEAINEAREANKKKMKKSNVAKKKEKVDVVHAKRQRQTVKDMEDPYSKFGAEFDMESNDEDDYALLHPNSPKAKATSSKEVIEPTIRVNREVRSTTVKSTLISKAKSAKKTVPTASRATRQLKSKTLSETKMLEKVGIHAERNRTNLGATKAAKKHLKQLEKDAKKKAAATKRGLLKMIKAKAVNEADNTVLLWPQSAVDIVKLCSAKTCEASSRQIKVNDLVQRRRQAGIYNGKKTKNIDRLYHFRCLTVGQKARFKGNNGPATELRIHPSITSEAYNTIKEAVNKAKEPVYPDDGLVMAKLRERRKRKALKRLNRRIRQKDIDTGPMPKDGGSVSGEDDGDDFVEDDVDDFVEDDVDAEGESEVE